MIGNTTAFPTCHFFEDVSGETLIFNIIPLKREPPTSPFCEDASGETPALGTFSGTTGSAVAAAAD